MIRPWTGRFLQADTVVPGVGNPGAWDRYAAMLNNPIRHVDPSGYSPCDGPYADPECQNVPRRKKPINPVPAPPTIHGRGQACAGPDISVLCMPIDEDRLDLPIHRDLFPIVGASEETTYPLSGLEDLNDIILFWEIVASPFTDLVDMVDIYNLTGSKGYLALRYNLPTGGIEAATAGYRQYYRDRFTSTLSPTQRGLRVAIVVGETYITDILASAAGDLAAIPGAVEGPIGAAAAYGLTASATTKFMDNFWQNVVNYNLPFLGVWPW